MLAMCLRDQWDPDRDLDWSVTPRPMPPEHERAVVQYFTDMAGIELLAGELFKFQRDRTDDPVLREIFATFVKDEIRHSEVAARLAKHYDVSRLERYETNPHLAAFSRVFTSAVRRVAPDIANAYITSGELLLDIALLRSLDDFVDDEMSHQAMRLINRDESRHIAVDFHMVEYYASEEYERIERERPARSPAELAAAWWTMARFFFHAGPFFKAVFFGPMDLVDPDGRRLLEAFKRMQLVGAKPRVAARPFSRYLAVMQQVFTHPVVGPWLGPAVSRAVGLDPRVIPPLYTEAEHQRAMHMSYDEMAREALEQKYLD